MSEVRIHDPCEDTTRVSLTITNTDNNNVRKNHSRDLSAPPTSGWRSRLIIDQESERKLEEEKKKEALLRQQTAEKETENKERKMRRVRRTSDRRKRLDTINSESDYSVSSNSLIKLLMTNSLRKTLFLQMSETSQSASKSTRRKKKEKRRIAAPNNNSPPPPKKSVNKTTAPGLK